MAPLWAICVIVLTHTVSRVCALPVADVLAGANKAYGHTVHAEPRQASTLRRHEEVGVKAWEAVSGLLTFFG